MKEKIIEEINLRNKQDYRIVLMVLFKTIHLNTAVLQKLFKTNI